jgi:AbrB family looped-hinge helix DNA binding protein
MDTIRASSKGQIVIPKAIREALDIRSGTELNVELLPGEGFKVTIRSANHAAREDDERVRAYARRAPRAVVMSRLRDLLSLRNVRAQNADLVFQALRWAAQGMDLADALHLVLSGKAERFATLDEALVKQGRKLGVQPAVTAP